MKTTLNKNEVLESTPHYSDSRFKDEQTVFGKPDKILSYEYSDRLIERDYDKSKQASTSAHNSGAEYKTAQWYENYLSAYFGKPVEIRHIAAGVNRSDGWDYRVFGFVVLPTQEKEHS